ncbi:MAG TPA: efflux RND transporter periplasmic adaptor subunit [Blastocatellia bacterium]|nr:efflux RND transporter periplasmic adaptor subunit [Blastocatellia bacterium]
MPISNQQGAPSTMDAEIKNLRIDRSAKQKNRSGRGFWRWILFSLGVSLLVGAALFGYAMLNTAVEVETVRVRAASTADSNAGVTILNATGYIIAAHKIELAARVSGRVAWIGVEKGDKVKQGQVLVRLEDEEFRARVTEAQGQLNSLKAQLTALENGSRPEETARSQADLEQVRADLENARVTLNRTRSLVEQGIMSRQTLDDAQARYDAQVARFASFEKTYALVRKGPRQEEIDAMRAQVKQAEGSLAFAQTQLDNTVITAPVSGAILERNVERGEFVTTGFVSDRGAKGYVVSLADLNDLQVELDISQNDFAKLGPRQPAVITTDAYPDRKYQGDIVEISPEANRSKATVQVKVKVLKPDEFLRPEMNASVAFYEPEKPDEKSANQTLAAKPLITIPSSAVRDGAVFIIVDERAVRRQVQTSGTSQQGATISNGLIGGEDLIVNPPADLKDGQKVRAKQ